MREWLSNPEFNDLAFVITLFTGSENIEPIFQSHRTFGSPHRILKSHLWGQNQNVSDKLLGTNYSKGCAAGVGRDEVFSSWSPGSSSEGHASK